MVRCSCGGSSCNCVVQAEPGAGVVVTGSGSATRPYLIGLTTDGDIRNQIGVTDTSTLNLEMSAPDSVGKVNIYGYATQKMTDLADVADAEGPQTGDSPIWINGHWEFRPQGTVNAGVIFANHGVGGDGSVGNPLLARTISEWAVGELLPWAAGSVAATDGQPVYVDTAGNLRTRPQVWQPTTAILTTTTPTSYPLGLSIMSLSAAQATAGGWPGAGTVVTTKRFNDNVAAQWWYGMNTVTPQAYYRVGGTSLTPVWSPWKIVVSDSGWVNITVNGTFLADTTPPQARLKNGIVYVKGGWGNTGITAPSTNYTVGNIPASYRPLVTISGRWGVTPTTAPGGMTILPNGDVQVRTGTTISSYYIFGGQSWPID